MATIKLQVRRDLATNWTAANPEMLPGEIGFETDTGKLKIGKNSGDLWNSLSYINSGSESIAISDVSGLQTALNGKTDSGHTHYLTDLNITGNAQPDTFINGDGVWTVIDLSSKANVSHTHTTANLTDFPSQTGNADKILSTSGSALSWIDAPTGGAVGDTTATANTVAQRDASADIYAHSFISSSDARLKKNIGTVYNALEIVQALTGRRFTWIETNNPDFGFIAQELETVIPEVVSTVNDSKSVNYSAIIPILVEAVKTLAEEIRVLKGE
jgi:hypothetical protein